MNEPAKTFFPANSVLLPACPLAFLRLQSPDEPEPAQNWDAKPSVMIGGILYGDTGHHAVCRTDESPEHGGHADGTITSSVDSSEYPTEDDQSNFGTGYAYRYGTDATVEVFFSDWQIFAPMTTNRNNKQAPCSSKSNRALAWMSLTASHRAWQGTHRRSRNSRRYSPDPCRRGRRV